MYLSVSKDGEPAPALHTCGSGFPAWMLPFSHVPPPSRASARVFPPPPRCFVVHVMVKRAQRMATRRLDSCTKKCSTPVWWWDQWWWRVEDGVMKHCTLAWHRTSPSRVACCEPSFHTLQLGRKEQELGSDASASWKQSEITKIVKTAWQQGAGLQAKPISPCSASCTLLSR